MSHVTDLASFDRWFVAHGPHLGYAGPDPHYALGLDRLAPSLRIACAEETPACALLRERGTAVWTPPGGRLIGNAEGALAVDAARPAADGVAAAERGRSAVALLHDPRAAGFIGGAGAALVAFKTSHALEVQAAALGWRLLASPAALGRRWENKVTFRALAGALDIPQPDGVVLDLADADHDALAARLGAGFVLQAAHGYAGNRTVRIRSVAALESAKRSLRARRVRATAWVEGTPITVNACATRRGIAVAAPFEQVTGLSALTPYALGSCGQRWAAGARGAPTVTVLAERLGEALANAGYRGFYGVDAVVAADGTAYAIEVNPRLVASIAAFTQLELLAGRLPLFARHLLAWLDPDADEAALDGHRAPLAGGQLVVHNVTGRPARLRAPLGAGAYRLGADGAPDFVRPGCHLADLRGADEVLLLPASTALPIPADAAWARLQALEPLSGAAGGPLTAEAQRIVAWLQGQLAGG